MTTPTQPAPRPLPNPGPPPAPAAETTHPQPTRPTTPPPPPRPTVPAPASGHLPSLSENIRKATMGLTWAIDLLGRQWDPTTGPQQDGGVLPSEVDAAFAAARTEIRIALLHLGDVAAMIPARQSTRSCLPGGPSNHHPRSGEGLTPGLADGVSGTGTRSDRLAPVAGSSHLAAYPASGGRTPGLVDAASHPTAGGTDGSGAAAPSRDAGDSSDPRPVSHSGGPDGPRREAGVGFTVPAAKPWMWSA